jgi:hypothetical protein
MEKNLLISAFLFTLIQLNAQSLQSDNFNSYTVGNVGTDIGGATAGQGGFYTDFASGSNSDGQIVNVDVSHGKSLQMTGSATAVGTRYIWKDGLNTAWAARTAGNNIIKITVSLYTGSVTAGAASGRALIYDSTYGKFLTGVGYNYATQKIIGLGYYTISGSTGNYSFSLGSNTYPANTWVTVSCTFDKATGIVSWTTPEGTFNPAATATPAGSGTDPFEFDLISAVATGNTVAHITSFDDYSVIATNAAALGTKEANLIEENNISLYPSPAADFITIKSKLPILEL